MGVRGIGLIVSVALAMCAAAPRSEACSCVGETPARYIEAVPLVFLARAEAVVVEKSGATVQKLRVLYTLKGSPGEAFTIRTPAPSTKDRRRVIVIEGCDRGYQEGEVALVFAQAGEVPSICAGNYDLSVVLPDIERFLELGPDRAGPFPIAAIAAALGALPEGTLAGALAPVHDPARPGKLVRARDRCVVLVGAPSGAQLAIDEAFRFGPIAKVRVTVPGSPRRWLFLLREEKGAWEVLHQVEQRLCSWKGAAPRWEPSGWHCSSPVAGPVAASAPPPPAIVARLARAGAWLVERLVAPACR